MVQQTNWPALDSEACRDTVTTLHLYTQVVGKVQLALSPSMRAGPRRHCASRLAASRRSSCGRAIAP